MEKIKQREKEINELKINVGFLGSFGSGKTTFIKVLNNIQNTKEIIVNDSIQKKIERNEKIIQFYYWDTKGYEKENKMSDLYLQIQQILLIFFDLSDKKSFLLIETNLLEQIKKLEKKKKNDFRNQNDKKCDFLTVLVGNKKDLKGKREVDFEEGKSFAEKQGWKYFEICCLDFQQVQILEDFFVDFVFNNFEWSNKKISLGLEQQNQKKERKSWNRCF
ncbi:P-loop containing nucleoside triphosphate hydrolase [Pseudocohnilembus persalinus]|uniref:p-loop containing nucleoside triphosphate hydrolase n=1 Tax=Pseudocohnilembus persalinus TaxID=266149 RepID=A0A0V0Q7I1_PSEPJ|nr:P-loop containing nucleoside triphosphate hydrolase [Pseudocohnilembus persalinus]|eukprot:KRW98133.1 P-loop containing nucleoside triphosphate hydrolase [Pseudocohnilembus persalinus]